MAGQRGKLEVINALRNHLDKSGKFLAGLEPRQSYQQNQKWATSFYIFPKLLI
jgi:hypothetical protein